MGSESLINEVDLVSIYVTAFKALQLPVTIKVNNRKILLALAQVCGGEDKLIDLTIAIDKLDKIGWEKVQAELSTKGFNDQQQSVIHTYLNIAGTNQEKLTKLADLLKGNENANKGIEELNFVLNYHQATGMALSLIHI